MADDDPERVKMAVLMIGEVPHGLFPTAADAEEWAKEHDRVDESKATVWFPIPIRAADPAVKTSPEVCHGD